MPRLRSSRGGKITVALTTSSYSHERDTLADEKYHIHADLQTKVRLLPAEGSGLATEVSRDGQTTPCADIESDIMRSQQGGFMHMPGAL